MDDKAGEQIRDFRTAVAVSAGRDDGEVFPHENIPFPDGWERSWREVGDGAVSLVCGDETIARVQKMDVSYGTLWEWKSARDTPGSGHYYTSQFQAQVDCAGWLEKMFSHAVREHRHANGIPEPRRPTLAEMREQRTEVAGRIAQARQEKEEAEIASGVRYRPTPPPWTAEHRHVHGTEKDDSIGGLGWEVKGPPDAPMRGQFARAADAHFAAACWDMFNGLSEIAEAPPGTDVAAIARSAMNKALPLVKYEPGHVEEDSE